MHCISSNNSRPSINRLLPLSPSSFFFFHFLFVKWKWNLIQRNWSVIIIIIIIIIIITIIIEAQSHEIPEEAEVQRLVYATQKEKDDGLKEELEEVKAILPDKTQ